jgi:hypothetical protein
LTEFWTRLAGSEHVLTLSCGLVLALLVGLEVQTTCRKYRGTEEERNQISQPVQKFLVWLGIEEFDSNLQRRLFGLVGEEIVVGLKNGRIYRGRLKRYDIKSDESITFEPIWSGKREPVGTVLFDTYYPSEADFAAAGLPWNTDQVEVTVMVSEIVSVARFNQDFDDFFVTSKKTKYDRHAPSRHRSRRLMRRRR